jgi:S-formylglutathione hydrolase FrmB
MGGYGAFKLALRKPDQYAAAASLSGALDMVAHLDNMNSSPLWRAEMERIFGPKIAGSENDLLQLLNENQASSGPRPLLYQCCGTEDFLYEQNQSFREACSQTDLQLTYEEEPGEHEWGYWDKKIQNVLKWLPLPERG